MFCCLYICCAQAYHRNRVQHGAAMGGDAMGRQMTEEERFANLHAGGVAGYGRYGGGYGGGPVQIEMHAIGGGRTHMMVRTHSGGQPAFAPGPAQRSMPMVVGYGGGGGGGGPIQRTLSGGSLPPGNIVSHSEAGTLAAIPMAQPYAAGGYDDDGSAAMPFAGHAVAVQPTLAQVQEQLRDARARNDHGESRRLMLLQNQLSPEGRAAEASALPDDDK